MDNPKSKRDRLLHAYPLCIYCGGQAPSETVDHCPPRAMFQEKKAPEGYEFGSCEACNQGTSDADLMVSAFARIGIHSAGNNDGKLLGLIKMANRQFPGMLGGMMPSALEARKLNRLLGIKPPPGVLQQHTGVGKVTDAHVESLRVFARKFTKAAFFKHADAIFPWGGAIAYRHFTNADAMREDFEFFETLRGVAGDVPRQVRTNVDLSGQFSYKVSVAVNRDVMILQVSAYKSFGFVTFNSTDPSVIRGAIKSLEQTTGHASPFELLQ